MAGSAGFAILVMEAIVAMVLFVPERVQQILDRGRAEGRAEARAQARAEFERALEDAEVSEELKAKIFSSVPADKNPAKSK